MARVFGLDVLRALAIWGVLLSHGKFELVGDSRFNKVFTVGGTLGVEAFFVLSGFLIGGILLRELGKPRPGHHAAFAFLLRRWFRTLPMYYAALALTAAMAFVWQGSVPGLSWTYLVFLQNAAAPPEFMHVTWSLTIEEWFYFIAASALLVVGGFRGSGRRLVAIALVMIAVSTIGRWQLALAGYDWEVTRTLLWFHFDAIAVGVLAAYTHHRFPAVWTRAARPAFIVGALLLAPVIASLAALRVATHVAPEDHLWYQVHWFHFAAIGVALLLPGLMAWKEQPGRLAAGITHVSLVSYSMYLIHLPIQGAMRALGLFTALPLGLSWAAWAIVVVGCSTVTYRYIEQPFLRLRDKEGTPWVGLTRPRPQAPAAVAATPPSQ